MLNFMIQKLKKKTFQDMQHTVKKKHIQSTAIQRDNNGFNEILKKSLILVVLVFQKFSFKPNNFEASISNSWYLNQPGQTPEHSEAV